MVRAGLAWVLDKVEAKSSKSPPKKETTNQQTQITCSMLLNYQLSRTHSSETCNLCYSLGQLHSCLPRLRSLNASFHAAGAQERALKMCTNMGPSQLSSRLDPTEREKIGGSVFPPVFGHSRNIGDLLKKEKKRWPW